MISDNSSELSDQILLGSISMKQPSLGKMPSKFAKELLFNANVDVDSDSESVSGSEKD